MDAKVYFPENSPRGGLGAAVAMQIVMEFLDLPQMRCTRPRLAEPLVRLRILSVLNVNARGDCVGLTSTRIQEILEARAAVWAGYAHVALVECTITGGPCQNYDRGARAS